MVRREVRGLHRSVPAPGVKAALDSMAPGFRTAVRVADAALERLGVPHALTGGVAVGAHSRPYATTDVDFLVGDGIFVERGESGIVYRKSEIPVEVAGVPIDLVTISTQRDSIQRIGEAALRTAAPSDERGIRVVQPEYLAAMKLVRNDPRDRAAVYELVQAGVDPRDVRELLGRDEQLLRRLERALVPA